MLDATQLPHSETSESLRDDGHTLDVSVVIPMYNAEETIGEQLESLARQSFEGTWEVVIADNGSTDRSVETAERWLDRLPSLRIIDASGKTGPAYARNVGTRASRGTLILYCDADDEVADGWLEAMWMASKVSPFLAALEDHGTLGPAGCVDIRPSPTSDGAFPFLPWIRGGNIGVSASVFEAVGGWNEKFHSACGEDIDFCWRVQLAGYQLLVVENALMRYRSRLRWRELARQHFHWGANGPSLYHEFADFGAPQFSARDFVRGFYWILSRFPTVFLSRERRHTWISGTAGRLGCLWGSMQCWLRRGSGKSS